MITLLANAATTKDIGLIATFGGIGVLVTVIMGFIFVQVRGERQQNKQELAERKSNGV